MIKFKGKEYDPTFHVIWNRIDWQRYVAEESKRAYQRGWKRAENKAVSEFVEDIETLLTSDSYDYDSFGVGVRMFYESEIDKIKDKWKQREKKE